MLLEEFLKPLHMTLSEFARHLGWAYTRADKIVDGKRGISANIALSLADTLKWKLNFS